MISALTEDSKNDAKGSAGDKHETALSMMHLEQEKLNHKLKEVLEQKTILDKIDSSLIHNTITVGSLVQPLTVLTQLRAQFPLAQAQLISCLPLICSLTIGNTHRAIVLSNMQK